MSFDLDPLRGQAARLPTVAELMNPVEGPRLSFEFFPPRDDATEAQLWAAIDRLAVLKPRFVSVTYGAGGTTQQRTHEVVERILRDTPLTPAAHLTCVGATRAEVDDVARCYWDSGVRHIVALRGDPPHGTGYAPYPGGYAYAADLVAGLRRIGDFEISVAAYPEGHPESASPQDDLDNLKRKLDAGATLEVTQYCFDTERNLRFLDRCAAAGITAPIVPGIMPIVNFGQVARFSARCGASVPSGLHALFEPIQADAALQKMIATAIAAEQMRILHGYGVRDFHIYTLNRPDLAEAIARLSGAVPAPQPNR